MNCLVYHLSSVIYHLPFTIYNLLAIIYHLSSIIFYLLSIIYHLPSIIYYLLFTIYHHHLCYFIFSSIYNVYIPILSSISIHKLIAIHFYQSIPTPKHFNPLPIDTQLINVFVFQSQFIKAQTNSLPNKFPL